MEVYGWIKASDSYNLLRKNINLNKIQNLCIINKIKNPFRKIRIIRKPKMVQLTLF